MRISINRRLASLPAYLLGLLVPTAGFAAQNQVREFALDGGRHLVIETQVVDNISPWLVYMPGSGNQLNPIKDNDDIGYLTQHSRFNVLVINKVGVELDNSTSDDDFQRGSVRGVRTQDNLAVIKAIVPANASILLMSLSEGSYISPDVAMAEPRVKGLILLSGNTWSWLEEEVRCLPLTQQGARRAFLENDVLKNPVFDKFYQDWSYAWFASYSTDQTYKTMLQLTLPVLMLNGDHDDVLWIEGAISNGHKLVDVEKKANIEFHVIPGGNHYLECADSAPSCDPTKTANALSGFVTKFADRVL